jgi:anti-sigma regulatory factor (Ser/Thr protein kinase)
MSRSADHIRLSASIDNLESAQAFMRQQAMAFGVPGALHLKLDLVVEELFINIVNHARADDKAEATIHCALAPESTTGRVMFCLTFKDNGSPFNPLERAAPSLEDDLDKRQIGGLGIHLITEMADHCSYSYEEEENVFTACFAFDEKE